MRSRPSRLQRLSTGLDRLRDWFVAANKRGLDASAGTDIVNENIVSEFVSLIAGLPVPSGVRAAAYRVLADMLHTGYAPTHAELRRAVSAPSRSGCH